MRKRGHAQAAASVAEFKKLLKTGRKDATKSPSAPLPSARQARQTDVGSSVSNVVEQSHPVPDVDSPTVQQQQKEMMERVKAERKARKRPRFSVPQFPEEGKSVTGPTPQEVGKRKKQKTNPDDRIKNIQTIMLAQPRAPAMNAHPSDSRGRSNSIPADRSHSGPPLNQSGLLASQLPIDFVMHQENMALAKAYATNCQQTASNAWRLSQRNQLEETQGWWADGTDALAQLRQTCLLTESIMRNGSHQFHSPPSCFKTVSTSFSASSMDPFVVGSNLTTFGIDSHATKPGALLHQQSSAKIQAGHRKNHSQAPPEDRFLSFAVTTDESSSGEEVHIVSTDSSNDMLM